jgi:thioredoxin 1
MGIFSKLLGLSPSKPPVHVDDGNFEAEVLRSSLPVVLDVWGPNCQPCKQLEPVIKALAATYDGRVKVAEMGIHFAPRAATSLRVTGTPTVLYMAKGREKERVVGVRASLYHEQTIEEIFGIPKKPS